MNNKRILLGISYLLILLFFSCNKKSTTPAYLQIVSMVPMANANITIISAKDSSKIQSTTLSYAVPSGYKKFQPGKYTITFSVDDKAVLQHTFALGKDSYQTLLAAGLMPDSSGINPQTFWYSAKNLLAGSEAIDPNGFLPQFIILRDRWAGSKSQGNIRFINSSPFANKIIIEDKAGMQEQALPYLHRTDPLSAEPRRHQLRFYLGNVLLQTQDIAVDKGYLHTIITGTAVSKNSFLRIISYKTATEAISKTEN